MMAAYVVGGKDNVGRPIVAIHSKTPDYVVYSTSDSNSIQDVHVFIDAAKEGDTKPEENYQKLKLELDRVKSLARHCDDTQFSQRAAYAISSAIHGDPDGAVGILGQMAKEMANDAIGKMWYIGGAFAVAVGLSLIAAVAYVFRTSPFLMHNTLGYQLLLVCAFATLGGLVSVARNVRDIDVISGFGEIPFFFYGMARNVYAVVGAVFIFAAIKCNLVAGFLSALTTNPLVGLCAVGFLAGFSEKLVPNTLNRLEQKAEDDAKKK